MAVWTALSVQTRETDVLRVRALSLTRHLTRGGLRLTVTVPFPALRHQVAAQLCHGEQVQKSAHCPAFLSRVLVAFTILTALSSCFPRHTDSTWFREHRLFPEARVHSLMQDEGNLCSGKKPSSQGRRLLPRLPSLSLPSTAWSQKRGSSYPGCSSGALEERLPPRAC